MYEELVKKLRYESTWRDDYPEDKAMLLQAADAIEQLEAAVPKWIPVTERLPEPYRHVVYLTIDKDVKVGAYIPKVHVWTQTAAIVSIRGDAVTHWIDLPLPPKEETE